MQYLREMPSLAIRCRHNVPSEEYSKTNTIIRVNIDRSSLMLSLAPGVTFDILGTRYKIDGVGSGKKAHQVFNSY